MAEGEKLRCPYCGHEIEEGDVLCLACGVNFIEGQELTASIEAPPKEEGFWSQLFKENQEVLSGLFKRLLIGLMVLVMVYLGYGGRAAQWAAFYGLLFAFILSGIGYGLRGEFQELFFWLGLAIGVISTIVVTAYSDYLSGFGGV